MTFRKTSLLLLLLIPALAEATTYVPLVGIPGVSNNATNLNAYINALYFLSISLAALLAVIKIIIAGVKYMTTDIVPTKGEAKSDIWGALLGLLLIVAAVLILTTINPNLANLTVLRGAPGVTLPPRSGGTVVAPTGGAQTTFNPDGTIVTTPTNNPGSMSFDFVGGTANTGGIGQATRSCTGKTMYCSYRVLGDDGNYTTRRSTCPAQINPLNLTKIDC